MIAATAWLALTAAAALSWPSAVPVARAEPAAAQPPVSVWLTTQDSWPAPHIALELAEFVAQEPQGSVFPLLSLLAANGMLSPEVSPREVYDALFTGRVAHEFANGTLADAVASEPAVLTFLSSRASVDLARMSLALHSTAPRIQTHFRFYLESVAPAFAAAARKTADKFDPECRVWADWDGRQVCDPADLARLVKTLPGLAAARPFASQPELQPFDHIFQSNSELRDLPAAKNLPLVVLYADVQAMSFFEMLSTLIDAGTNRVLRFALRYIPPLAADSQPLYLTGYGVELAIKSTEYKVEDDRSIKTEAASGSAASGSRDAGAPQEDDLLFQANPVIKTLTKEQIDDIALRAATFIAQSTWPLDALTRVSQDFPKHAHLLASIDPDPAIKTTVKQIGQITHEDNKLLLNGFQVDIASLDAFKLLRQMREEIASLAPFKKLQWSTLEAIELLSTPLEKRIATSWGECFDTRSPTVTWINDIEKDSRYRSLPKSIREVARPSYPGQLKLVRKNLFSLVVMVDLTNAEHHAIITSVLGFVEGNVPLRFGFVFLPDEGQELDHPATMASLAAYWLVEHSGKKPLAQFLGDVRHLVPHALVTARLTDKNIDAFQKLAASAASSDGVTAEAVRAAFHKASGKSYSAVIEGRDLKNSELVLKLISLAERLGVSRQSGAMFGNGKHIDIAEGWQQELIQTYFAMIEYMKNLVYLGQLTDETDIYELFMTMDNVYPKRNPFVFPSATNVAEFVNWATLPGIEAIEALPWLQAHSKSTPSETTLILFGDFASMDGVRFALAAADAVATSTRSVRLSFVHNAADRSRSEDAVLVDEVAKHFHDAESGLDGFRSALKAAIVAGSAHFGEEFAAPEFRGLRSHALQPLLAESDAMPGQFGVVAGARIITPLSANQLFDSNDFMSLLTFEASSRNANLASRIALMRKGLDSRAASDLIFKTISLVLSMPADNEFSTLDSPPPTRVSPSVFAGLRNKPGTFSVGMPEFASIHISAIINPASHDGQKAAAILRSISGLSHVAIEVFLAPQEGNGSDKLPIQRFYRYLLKTEPTFDAYGRRAPVAVTFSRIPTAPLLTLGMDVVGAWLVRPTRSVYDLDNIKLSSLSPDAVARGVEAEFVLQSILVEGHARDSASNGPPRGLQFVLGTPSEPNMVDTITMANLGYLQLKANPGVWLLQIRDGRSREIYELESVRYASSRGIANVPLVHGSDGVPNSGALIVVDSFTGVTIFPRVHKRLGKEAEDVLQPAPTGVAGMWDKVKNKVTNTLGLKRSETINIFSVASGHLYERFLSIMMLSVKRQTRSPVKFWLIENFLSPSFMEFLPHLAKTFRFEYELVTYKWPKWLREQSEKQRIIWGYKILFLDVLFPLKLDKVIFVDADQVVRADLKELADMDLDGAVYGYTPFCSDRTEMDGFRFWNHGYWKEHLQGKPYHISALYVVDLVKFRELAAGDRLRQQYHMLSADPNSLANLDQDLPNNMIHQLPIFSLPQEWLWCETWCSDYSLRKAKTIDLCNNPMTKEPKLERARRILPEWEGLDRQVQRVRDEFESARKQAAPAAAASTSVSDGSGGHSEL